MKKLFVLILVLLMLCACGVQEEPVVQEPDVEVSEPKTEFFTAANGKSGAKHAGKVIIEPEYTSLELYDDFILAKNENVIRLFGYDGVQRGFDYEFFSEIEPAAWSEEIYSYVGTVSSGKVKYIESSERYEPVLKEAPGEKYYLIGKEGYPLIDIPLEDCEIWKDNKGAIEILGAANGNHYHAKIEPDGKKTFEETKPKNYIDEFGYEHTEYQYHAIGGMLQGLIIDGEVFLEPIYKRITVPFNDRFIIWYASFEQCLEGGFCKIIDLDKNELSGEFNHIEFVKLEDGWCIGIARSAGEMSEDQIFDKNGNPREKGMWFIDKDGNIISPKIQANSDEPSADYYGYNFAPLGFSSINDVITVLDENGEEMEIAIKDYAFKP